MQPIFRETDVGFQGSHPSFQEVLTAAQFADEINSGQLSVEDAYKYCWSYKEDAELWGLPKDREWRALLPAGKNILLFVIGMLKEENASEFIEVVSGSYFAANNFLGKDDYNPHFDDFCFAGKCISENPRIDNGLCIKIRDEAIRLLDSECNSKKVSSIELLGELGHFGPKSVGLLLDKAQEDYIRSNLLEGECGEGASAAAALVAERVDEVGHYNPTELLRDKHPWVRGFVAYTLGESGRYDPQLVRLLEDENQGVCRSAAYALDKVGPPEIIPKLRRHLNTQLRDDIYHAMHSIHQRLKPKGYVAPERLAA